MFDLIIWTNAFNYMNKFFFDYKSKYISEVEFNKNR